MSSIQVILGAHYDQRIDVWSYGAVLAELFTGNVLFQNDSVASMLARITAILGPLPAELIKDSDINILQKFISPTRHLFIEKASATKTVVMYPKVTLPLTQTLNLTLTLTLIPSQRH